MIEDIENKQVAANTVETLDIPEKENDTADQIFSILADNYIDSEGNLIGWQEFEYNENHQYGELRRLLDADGTYELEAFLYENKNILRLVSQIENEQSNLKKVALTKLLGDVCEAMIRDEESFDAKESAMQALKKISENNTSSYFIKSFAHTIYSQNLETENWWNDDLEGMDEIEKSESISNMHQSEFDGVQFQFTPEMLNKMNYESRDYGSPSEMEEAHEARPGEDYIVLAIAPEVIGVFAMDGNLIGWQNIVLNNDKEILLNSPMKIRDLVAFENPKEDLAFFKILSSLSFRNNIASELKINLSEFDLRTQYQFLKYIKENSAVDLEEIKEYMSPQFNEKTIINRMRAFLPLEIDSYNGEKILSIAKNLNSNDSDLIFGKISQLVDLATKESEELQELTGANNNFANVQTELLKKTNEIILEFANEIDKKEIDKEKINQLLIDLERSKTEIFFLASFLKSIKNEGLNISLEQIRDMDFEIKDFEQEFSDDEKEEMLSIAEINWRQNPNMKDVVVKSFEKSLSDAKNQKFYVLKYQGKIVSFVRFEKTERGTLYAGSFNVYPDARSTGIGEEMMNRALKKESEDSVLEATVSPRIPAGTAYVERAGFVINGIIANYHETGEPLFNIELDNEKNLSYQYRNEGKEIQISEEELKKQVWTNENLEHIIGSEVIALAFDMQNDFEKMKAVMEKLLVVKNDNSENLEEKAENKYLITRYFRDKDEQERDVRYFVFEKLK